MRAFSKPFDLKKFAPERWIMSGEDVDWLAELLDDSPHEPCFPLKQKKFLREADAIEIKAMRLSDWKKNGKKSNS